MWASRDKGYGGRGAGDVMWMGGGGEVATQMKGGLGGDRRSAL